jgi:putative ABC transport system substrate-binding protein
MNCPRCRTNNRDGRWFWGAEALDGAFSAMAGDRAGALFVPPDGVFWTHRARIADLAARHRLPTMYGFSAQLEAGGLMAYGPDVVDNYRRAAGYVAKILKGARPADLPVEQPTKFELTINLKTARALGLTIPPALLARADHLIE